MGKKLEKVGKPNASDLEKCIAQLRTEIESGTLLTTLKTPKSQQQQQTTQSQTQATITQQQQQQEPTSDYTNRLNTNTSSKTTDDIGADSQPSVLKRFPSLTWRQANERARILFYKGRTPSIHYNEKRDSFRVSMLAEVIKDGQHKVAEVPVTDDDVRRLLNSFGLYWDGESISLLAKSDEIFTSAQQEAFDYILNGATSNTTTNTAGQASPSSPQVTENNQQVPAENSEVNVETKLTLLV